MKTEVLTDYLGRHVRLTRERRKHILEHPEMQDRVEMRYWRGPTG